MPALHDRESIYRFLWENCDRRHFITLSQQEVSKKIHVGYQRLSEIYLEFIYSGRMKKYQTRFQIKDPDTLDWGEDFEQQVRDFRANRGR
jgi:hypothetical protein